MSIILYAIQFIETSLLFSALLFSTIMFVRTRDHLARRTLMVLFPVSALLFISYMYSINVQNPKLDDSSLIWLSPLFALVVIMLIMASILATCNYVIQLLPVSRRKKRIGIISAGAIVGACLVITGILVMYISKSDLSMAITNALWAFYPLCSVTLFIEAVPVAGAYKKIKNPHDQRLAKYFLIAFFPQIIFSVIDFILLRKLSFQLTHLSYAIFSLFVFVDLCTYFFKSYNIDLDIFEEKQNLKVQYTLSEREIEVVDLLAKGMTNQIISEKLHISINTVKSHVKSIYKKMNISNRLQLINLLRGTNVRLD